jgi:ABC-2 type transport system permease protein
MLRRIAGLVRKEIRVYVNSPVAYLALLFFVLAASIQLFFVEQFLARNVASLRSYFGIFPLLYSFILPALTMRSFAEERRSGTDELLLTLPMREFEVVAGKYLAALSLVAVMLLLTLPVPWTLTPLGDFDSGEILGEYIGTFLLAASGLAFGLFVSALSTHQISAFIVGLSGLLLITFLRSITLFLQLPEPLASLLTELSLQYRFQSFTRGVVDTRDLLFFLLTAFVFLYGTARVLVLRRWK